MAMMDLAACVGTDVHATSHQFVRLAVRKGKGNAKPRGPSRKRPALKRRAASSPSPGLEAAGGAGEPLPVASSMKPGHRYRTIRRLLAPVDVLQDLPGSLFVSIGTKSVDTDSKDKPNKSEKKRWMTRKGKEKEQPVEPEVDGGDAGDDQVILIISD
ncbi:hypothetical protein CspHIS471_0310220 [Cutaneotrichosporon sp. HIS471]|nr:hypothetical protein CspHIS471_0310220 [Cutaneotrichosporon sp. HIS471]